MKTQHTPGPWEIQNIDNAEVVFYIKCKSGNLGSAYNKAGGEGLANARLIASAPELLAALIEAKELLESVRHRMPKSIRNHETFHFENVLANSITKTIRKATQP